MKKNYTYALTEDQYHIIVNSLNELRTRCIKENIDTTDIDYLLLALIRKHEKYGNKEHYYNER